MMYARANGRYLARFIGTDWHKVDRLGKAWYPSGVCEVAYIDGREYKTKELDIIIVAE